MPGVSRPAILPYVGPEAPVLLVLLTAFMARPAQRLQLAQPELIPVALVRLDMVSDHSAHDQTLLQAVCTKRMLAHLETLLDLPSTKPVPVARIARPIGHADFFAGIGGRSGKSFARTKLRFEQVSGDSECSK